MVTPALADKLDASEVNGPQDADLDRDAIYWRPVEDDVRRLRRRIFKASQAGDLKRVRNLQETRRPWGLLEPDAVKVARPVLRGPGRSNALGLPDQLSHTLGAASAVFDDPNLVSSAGLVPLVALAESAGLRTLAQERLTVPTDKGANAG